MAQMIFEQTLIKAFILVLNMSLTACVVILAVMAARIVLRKAPRIYLYALWAAVLFRLLCPVSFSLPVSLLGALQNEPAKAGRMEYITEDIVSVNKPETALPVPGLNGAAHGLLSSASPEHAANPMQIAVEIGAYLWMIGIFGMGIYSGISLWKLQKRLKGARHEKENIYRFRGKGSPFVYGVLCLRIYLPQEMGEEEEQYILLHEQIHMKRGDAIFRLLAYAALWLHWFNPLVWLAFVLSGRDMEMSCDEAVIRKLGNGIKKKYSASLLHAAAGHGSVRGIPIAFGEGDTKGRIKNVLRYRKPAAFFIGMASSVCVLLAVFVLANPAESVMREDMIAAAAGTETEKRENLPPAETTDTVQDVVQMPVYTDRITEDTGSEWMELLPERLRNGELLDGLYIVNVRSISKSARGFDRYVTEEEGTDLPLLPFAEECVFLVNRQMDKLLYEEVDFDAFADLVTAAADGINPGVYCEIADNQVVRASLDSAYYLNGISYERPVKDTWKEDMALALGMETEEALAEYYVLRGTEMADIADSAGDEKIEVYTGNIGDGESGAVFFQDAAGNVLGTEFAHASRAGWNNIYIGKADGVGFILTVHIEDRGTYGGYDYQVYRFGEAGEIMQIAGSRFEFGENRQYDDALFRTWADSLSCYLERSHLILSSQEGQLRTERVSEADKYNYETLRRKL